MIVRENERRKELIRFNGDDIALATKMLEELSMTFDILYYLMNRREERAFVVMLVTAKDIKVGELLAEQKRNTDILFEIDKERSIYVVICQDTKIDGGYRFGERLMKYMHSGKARDPFCIELEVRTTTHDFKYIIFQLIEMFITVQQEKKSDQITFKTLN